MRRVLFGFAAGILVIPAATGLLWLIDAAAGTGWALPVGALIGLPLLAVTFRSNPR